MTFYKYTTLKVGSKGCLKNETLEIDCNQK